MKLCPLCGQPIPEDIKVHEELSLGDPQIAVPLSEFVKYLGLSKPKQAELLHWLKGYSTKAVLYALRVFKQKGIYANPEIKYKLGYFKAIVKKRHEELQHEAEEVGLPLEYDPKEYE